jgi:glycosyltransferase involved in cell wall biosynthesis
MNDELIPEPFFSVIITTYNRASLVTRALKSVIAQTEKDWEVIIIDDESTDDTYIQLLPYLKSYSNIKFIRQIHRGEAQTKNAGIWNANGKFITFLDSDDEFDPRHLELRKAVLNKNPTVKFLYGGITIIGNHYVPDRFNYANEVNLKDCTIGGTFFIGRNIAVYLDGFRDILFGADADLFDRARKSHITVMEVVEPTYIYHHENLNSITHNLRLS